MKYAVMILLLCAIILLSLFFGAASLSTADVIGGLMGHGTDVHQLIIRDLRLPRTLLGAVIGAGLGASGAALQGYTRNPLAGPGILGFSACAALGAVTALYFGWVNFVPIAALFGTALGATLILLIAGQQKGASILILAGVGVGALATALTGLIMNFAPNPWALSEMVYWLMGSLKNAELGSLMIITPLSLIGLLCLFLIAPDLRTLSLGEDTGRSLGVSISRVRTLMIAGTALCVGSGVAYAGAIGFVGLFIPHICRLFFGADPARLIIQSTMAGASFLILADIITRALSGPGTQLYLGILTSLIGVPFFLYLAVKAARS